MSGGEKGSTSLSIISEAKSTLWLAASRFGVIKPRIGETMLFVLHALTAAMRDRC
jgi:hypothetical protein